MKYLKIQQHGVSGVWRSTESIGLISRSGVTNISIKDMAL